MNDISPHLIPNVIQGNEIEHLGEDDLPHLKMKYHQNGHSRIKRDINLNLLITLEILLKECSVGKTAKQLGVSQAAVSAQLTKLRHHFQDDLLVVRKRNLTRTSFAETLISPLEKLLNDARNLSDLRHDFDPSKSERVFNILAGDISTFSLLSELNKKLEKTAPGITLNIRGESGQLSDVDFTILPGGILDDSSHLRQKLYEDEFCILADINHQEVGDEITLDNYLKLKHVVRYFGDTGVPSVEASAMLKMGYQRKISAVVNAYGSIPFFLLNTQYISTVPASFAKQMVSLFPLKMLPLPFKFPPVVIYLFWNKYLDHDPVSMWMKQNIIDAANLIYTRDV